MELKDMEKEVTPPNLNELRIEFMELRKFEISNLWQRSIFLVTFITAGIVTYSQLVSYFFENDNLRLIWLHILCLAIAGINLVFSELWIMMAKGSKAWQEVYESYVCELDEDCKVEKKYKHGAKTHGDNAVDTKLYTLNAGAFSPSKVNILIGQVFFVIWALAILLHIGFIYSCVKCWLCGIIAIALLVVIIVTVYVIHRFGKSSFLKTMNNKEWIQY